LYHGRADHFAVDWGARIGCHTPAEVDTAPARERPAMSSTSGKTRLASMIGNALEWYDFAIYGYFAAVLGQHFFPSDDAAVSVIAAFGVFAIGFLARPFGSVLFGNIGDRVGRRRVLIVSVLAMAAPTTLVGFLPTYAEIGPWAPATLIALRGSCKACRSAAR
jgi:MHS family proline/betaine transporter-like MFS transporter